MSERQITRDGAINFLTYLASQREVSPNTQNQAFSALLFLFRDVLGLPFEDVDAVRARQTQRIPVVLSVAEVKAILANLSTPYSTMIMLAWGGGLRKTEILRLRIKDVDFERKHIIVRQGKGNKDRVTLLPECAVDDLKTLILRAENIYRLDCEEGFASVQMPNALAKKFPVQAIDDSSSPQTHVPVTRDLAILCGITSIPVA